MMVYQQDALARASSGVVVPRHDAIRAAVDKVNKRRPSASQQRQQQNDGMRRANSSVPSGGGEEGGQGTGRGVPQPVRGERVRNMTHTSRGREAVLLKAVTNTMAKCGATAKRSSVSAARASSATGGHAGAARRQADFDLYDDADDAALDKMVYEHQMRMAQHKKKHQEDAEVMAAKGRQISESPVRSRTSGRSSTAARRGENAENEVGRSGRRERGLIQNRSRQARRVDGDGDGVSDHVREGREPLSAEELEQMATDHRREVSARRIQRCFASFTRRRARRERDRRAAERAMRHAIKREKEEFQRRKADAHALSEIRKHRSCVILQRWWRSVLRRRRVAAICLQASWRGLRGRRRAAVLAEERQRQRVFRAFLDAKATSIQTGVRAWLARRTVDKARREWQMRTAAALRVQSVWRGCLGRRFAREILHEKIKEEQRRDAAASTIARAYRFFVRRRDGRVMLFFRRMTKGFRTPQQLKAAAVILQRQWRRRQLLVWAHREYVKVGKAAEAKQHLRMMNECDEYRAKHQAPVTTAGIGYVVVTSRPLWMETVHPSARARDSSAAEEQLPPAGASQGLRQARAQQAAMASRAMAGAAEQAASYGIAYDITRGVTLQSPTRGGPPISVYVPAPGRAPADRTRLAQLEMIQKRQRQTVGALPSIHVSVQQAQSVALPPPAGVTHVTALPPVTPATARRNGIPSDAARTGTSSPVNFNVRTPGSGHVAGGHLLPSPPKVRRGATSPQGEQRRASSSGRPAGHAPSSVPHLPRASPNSR